MAETFIKRDGTDEEDAIKGTNSNDKIRGLGGDDIVNGRGGNDDIDGGKGNDILSGGQGQDTIFGGEGQDVLKGGDQDDQLFGHDNEDLLLGGDGQDLLFGGTGNDTLDGGTGDDFLTGDEGADVLTGGAGKDTFLFHSTLDSTVDQPDLITDFQQGQDKIDLSFYNMDPQTFETQKMHFVEFNPDLAVQAGEVSVHFDARIGRTVVDIGVDSAPGADARIELEGNVHLTANDFNFGNNQPPLPDNIPIL